MKTLTTALIAFLLFPAIVCAQKKQKVQNLKLKFGDIKAEMFTQKHPLFDSTADAIILNDIGHSRFEGNSDGWFTLIYKRHQRIKVLNKTGADAANFSIPLYGQNSDKERIKELKASSFNLDNGQVVETKLDTKQVFEEKVARKYAYTKFGVPQVKEGSIIEVEYEVHSKYLFNLQPWEFQDTHYPRVWSEYMVEIPELFNYVVNAQGYYPFHLKEEMQEMQAFNIIEPGANAYSSNEVYNMRSNVIFIRWVMKDIPALKKEPFTSSYENHISKLEFQLAGYRFPNVPEKKIMPNWKMAAEELLQAEDFGIFLSNAKLWMGNDARDIVGSETDPQKKAMLIYGWLRDKIACTGNEGIYTKAAARSVLKDRKGVVADINMLLVVMLRQVGLEADPMLISTRNNGKANDFYPLMSKYNYVLCRLKLAGQSVFLDASKPRLGFGHLDPQAYNGMGFVVAPMPEQVAVVPALVTESPVNLVFIVNDDSLGWHGKITKILGRHESYRTRSELLQKGDEDFFKDIAKKYPDEIKLSDFRVDSLTGYESNLQIKYDVDLNSLKEADMIYFNPFTGIESMQNPFKSEERHYPVELPSRYNEKLSFMIAIPEGYALAELPKSIKILLDKEDGFYKHQIAEQNEHVVIQTQLVINKTEFDPDEYEPLRQFFSLMIARQQAQIVFKKKS